jgi:hypothetical protein
LTVLMATEIWSVPARRFKIIDKVRLIHIESILWQRFQQGEFFLEGGSFKSISLT